MIYKLFVGKYVAIYLSNNVCVEGLLDSCSNEHLEVIKGNGKKSFITNLSSIIVVDEVESPKESENMEQLQEQISKIDEELSAKISTESLDEVKDVYLKKKEIDTKIINMTVKKKIDSIKRFKSISSNVGISNNIKGMSDEQQQAALEYESNYVLPRIL